MAPISLNIFQVALLSLSQPGAILSETYLGIEVMGAWLQTSMRFNEIMAKFKGYQVTEEV